MNTRSLHRWFAIPALLVCLMAIPVTVLKVTAAERVYIDITQPFFKRIPVAIPDLKMLGGGEGQVAREASGTLAKDLELSGLFRPLDPSGVLEDPQKMGLTEADINFPSWRRAGADYLARGGYEVAGSRIKLQMRFFDSVTGRLVVGKVYEGDVRDWPAMMHRFADEILMALTGEAGVFGTKIAFVQSTGKNKEIFVADFDGSHVVQVTHDNSIDLSPAWSPDGTRIAYTSYREKFPKIFVSSLADGGSRVLCGYPGLNSTPAWRPGGGELAVTLSTEGNPDIFLVSSSGAIVRKLVGGPGNDTSPSWSPDGHKLAYVSDETGNPQIYVLDLGSGQKRRVSFNGNYNTSPSWSPKGDLIAYCGTSGGRYDIFVVRADGGGARALTSGPGSNVDPRWSPDGRMLVFGSTRDGSSAIWIMSANGEGARRLTKSSGEQQLPSWSPRSPRRE
ncbi:MAG TPA: Tol-Pal system beta propeller repeat protein TolB [Syntrophobacteraceae bacterium]|nr:Tol-Pal system beta propeller repeat protein TolB [Syntrophobacteraceae bacterium]